MNSVPATGSIQKLSALSRGNAMSGAPSISGTAKFASPANAGMMNTKIIRYRVRRDEAVEALCVSKNCIPGWASSARNSIARKPPTRKKKKVVTRYWIPITLWSVLTLK